MTLFSVLNDLLKRDEPPLADEAKKPAEIAPRKPSAAEARRIEFVNQAYEMLKPIFKELDPQLEVTIVERSIRGEFGFPKARFGFLPWNRNLPWSNNISTVSFEITCPQEVREKFYSSQIKTVRKTVAQADVRFDALNEKTEVILRGPRGLVIELGSAIKNEGGHALPDKIKAILYHSKQNSKLDFMLGS